MKNTVRKMTTLMLALLFTASLPLTALAEVLSLDISDGSIDIYDSHATQNAQDHDHDGTVIVTGRSTDPEYSVTVDVTSNVTVVLQDTTINTYDASSTINDAAVQINTNSSNAVVTVELNGTNTLTSDRSHAGLEISGTGAVVIQDKTSLVEGNLVDTPDGGSLTATGGRFAAGIGGGDDGNASNITITGGTVTATGHDNAAGIGGGDGGSASNITITGGTVTANGGANAAGIGGGEGGSASNITITGGNVTAEGRAHAAGIGGGDEGNASKITITGDSIVTATGGGWAAGIGSGSEGNADSITITGGTVIATGGRLASGIGGGNNGSVGSVAISGGTVTATGGNGGVGIGGVITGDTSISFSGNAQVTAIGGENANHIGGEEAVEPDVSGLSASGWYRLGVNGEKIYRLNNNAGAPSIWGPEPAPMPGEEAVVVPESAEKTYFTVSGAWRQKTADGVLTVTSQEMDAVFKINVWSIQGLLNIGVHTVVFVTAEAETTLDLAELKLNRHGGDKYVLTHTGAESILTLNGEIV